MQAFYAPPTGTAGPAGTTPSTSNSAYLPPQPQGHMVPALYGAYPGSFPYAPMYHPGQAGVFTGFNQANPATIDTTKAANVVTVAASMKDCNGMAETLKVDGNGASAAGVDVVLVTDVKGGARDGTVQDDREVKKQRRKQSNRESARRSRLRKQAQCEELGGHVNSLTVENVKLKEELSQLQATCASLAADNQALEKQLESLGKGKATAAAAGTNKAAKETEVTTTTANVKDEPQGDVDAGTA